MTNICQNEAGWPRMPFLSYNMKRFVRIRHKRDFQVIILPVIGLCNHMKPYKSLLMMLIYLEAKWYLRNGTCHDISGSGHAKTASWSYKIEWSWWGKRAHEEPTPLNESKWASNARALLLHRAQLPSRGICMETPFSA